MSSGKEKHAAKFPKAIKLHSTPSVVKVEKGKERIIESPDDLIRLNVKKTEVDWVRNKYIYNLSTIFRFILKLITQNFIIDL